MKKQYALSLLPLLMAHPLSAITIEKITIEEDAVQKVDTKKLGKEELKFTRQMDLGEILSETLPEITHVRASSVGNDIILRGQKKDNINVMVDGQKVCGACPNRMDPPAMHVSSSQIQHIEVKEGPFDVKNFGSLSGMVNVVTKDPESGIHGTLAYTKGSFGYDKKSIIVEGGDETVTMLVGFSKETSEQYKDGDGKTLAEQVKDSGIGGNAYLNDRMKAYTRDNLWAKAVIKPTDSQKLTMSYFSDDAVDVLYPAFSMDAQVDKTTMLGLKYELSYLSAFSEKLLFEAYDSKVEHEMGNAFRKSKNATTTMPNGMEMSMYRTHAVDATIRGLRIENQAWAHGHHVTIGFDTSLRNWDGRCVSEPSKMVRQIRIPDVDTQNSALYLKTKSTFNAFDLAIGMRSDSTTIEASKERINHTKNPSLVGTYYAGKEDNDYNNFSANALLRYNHSDATSAYIGVGQSARVPDAKELYFIAVMNGSWKIQGNPDLDPTINREVDLGLESVWGDTLFKVNYFHSQLTDFIYAHKSGMTTTFSNIDATITGGDISLETLWGDMWVSELGAAWQKGEKEDPLAGQSDKDLAEIPPLKVRAALKYEASNYYSMAEVLHTEDQTPDKDNGEVEVDGYTTFNLRGGYAWESGFQLNAGIDNLFDETYAVNNTYVGRGMFTGTTDIVLLNEPGRSYYINGTFRF